MAELVKFNITNNMIIFININQIDQKSRANRIQEEYTVLQQNIDTGVYDSSRVSEVVNSIIVNFKYLYDENFKYNQKSCKDTLETGLGLLKVFNGYKEKEFINDKIFASFNDFLYERIDSLSYPINKNDMYEEICIYEILKSNELHHDVYNEPWGYSRDYNIFDQPMRDKFCSIHFQKVLKTLSYRSANNPKIKNELYLSLIKKYNEILNIKDNKEQILLVNS